MKPLTSLLIWLALSLLSRASVFALDGGSLPAKQPDPLPQAVEEFKILTRDMGMRPDSPPTVQTHQGRKIRWHGRVYENFRNDVLDAVPHEVRQNGENVSPLRRNQFGFNVAGPVLIPDLIDNPQSTFLLFSYEGVREQISRASLHTIPTMAQRSGNFSETVDQAGNLLPIYDPNTTIHNPAYDPSQAVSTSNLQYLRSMFPGNTMPRDRLAADVQQALSLYPAPNTAIGPFFQNNYFVNAPQTDDADGIIAKLQHSFGDRHRLTSLSTTSRGFLSPAQYFPNLATPTAPDQHFSNWRTELDYVFTANSKTINSASVAVSSHLVQAGENADHPFPNYQLGNYLSMGVGFPASRNVRATTELLDTLSTQKARHSLQLTGQVDFYHVNSFDPAYPTGAFQFSSDITSLPGITGTGDPFAGFLLGLPAYVEQTVITAPSYFRDSYQSASVSDKYEISKNLAMTAGLNLSRRSPRVEKYNRQSTVDRRMIDPATGLPGALSFAGRNGISRGMRPSNIDLDPSLGLAWNPRGTAKTVVRAAFNRSHTQIPIYYGQWGTQGFNARQTFVSANTQLSPALELANGIPPLATPLPDLRPSAANNTVADFVDLSGREPVYQTTALSVEREIPGSMVVSVGGNHRTGADILVGDAAANPNAINPSLMSYGNALYDEAFRATLQPYPQYKGFELYSLYPAGHYERDSGYVRVEKRASFGLSFSAYYEISKQFDDYSGPYGNQDLFNPRNDWALSSYNPPQYLQLTYAYELPFGPDAPLVRLSGWGGTIVSGWSVTGTAYWNDGTPLALHPEFNNTGDVLSTLNVSVVPGVDPHVASPGPSRWFNPAAFDQPPDFTMGNGPRTLPDLLGPGYNSMDLSLNKRLPVGGERSFEFSATAFNLLNHGNWNYPDPDIGPADAPNVNAGRIIGSHGGRVVQVGLKFSF